MAAEAGRRNHLVLLPNYSRWSFPSSKNNASLFQRDGGGFLSSRSRRQPKITLTSEKPNIELARTVVTQVGNRVQASSPLIARNSKKPEPTDCSLP